MIRRQAGPGPLVLWVHGYTLDGSVWAPIWAELPQFAHAALDLPGHGDAARPPGKGLFAAAVEAVEAAALALGARRLVAMSYGGAVALELLGRSPGLFDTVVLASPGVIGGPVDQESADCHLEMLAMARDRGLGPWLGERWLSQPPQIFAGLAQRPARFEPIAEVVRRHRFAELLDPASAELSRSAPRFGRLAQCPDLRLLVGEDDMPAFKRCAELIRRAAPGAQRQWLAGGGHQVLLEEPRRCAELISPWLALPAPPPGNPAPPH